MIAATIGSIILSRPLASSPHVQAFHVAELGYMKLHKRGAELLFQVLT